VKPVRRLSALGVSAACAFAVPALSAQVTNTLDAGVSIVRYDGFLSSGAASVSPTLHAEAPHASATARGTLLMFESGNRSLQGSLSGVAFSPSLGPIRFEAAAEAGTSAYAGFDHFAHLLGEVRLHRMSRNRGLWAGFTAGRAYDTDSAFSVHGWEAGVWKRSGPAWLSAAWTAMRVGDTTFTDAVGRARWVHGRLETEGSFGARFASRGGGHGAYGEASAVLWLSSGLALVAGGGRYPSDPVRGSIPGRYASIAMRLGQRSRAQRRDASALPASRSGARPPVDATAASSAVRMELGRANDGARAIRLFVPDAVRVEIMGDFSDWQPIPMVRTDGAWEVALPLRAGLYRFNVRVDGGPWRVPGGVALERDDFDSVVGVLVIP